MNAIEFFEELGVLDTVRWRSLQKGPNARILRRKGSIVSVQVALPFCGTWIEHSDMGVNDFLSQFKPQTQIR
jgi:hypothetical protein